MTEHEKILKQLKDNENKKVLYFEDKELSMIEVALDYIREDFIERLENASELMANEEKENWRKSIEKYQYLKDEIGQGNREI